MKSSYGSSDDLLREDEPDEKDSVTSDSFAGSFDSGFTARGDVPLSSEYESDVVSPEDVSKSKDNAGSGSDLPMPEDVAVFHEAESVPCEEMSVFREIFARCKPQRNVNARDDVVSLREELSGNEFRSDRVQEATLYELVSPEISFRTIDAINREQNWSDSLVSLPVESVCEPASEMYYTASSEVSLLSDTEVPLCVEKTGGDDSVDGKDSSVDRKDCVIAGHVAAMRERFESMTRTNTPCPDMMRSISPSLDVFGNITPSPDRLG